MSDKLREDWYQAKRAWDAEQLRVWLIQRGASTGTVRDNPAWEAVLKKYRFAKDRYLELKHEQDDNN